jgi:hypothetical protein
MGLHLLTKTMWFSFSFSFSFSILRKLFWFAPLRWPLCQNVVQIKAAVEQTKMNQGIVLAKFLQVKGLKDKKWLPSELPHFPT